MGAWAQRGLSADRSEELGSDLVALCWGEEASRSLLDIVGGL